MPRPIDTPHKTDPARRAREGEVVVVVTPNGEEEGYHLDGKWMISADGPDIEVQPGNVREWREITDQDRKRWDSPDTERAAPPPNPGRKRREP